MVSISRIKLTARALAGKLIACKSCDLLVKRKPILPGYKAACPRCANLLYQPTPNSVERTLALSITGLLLFIPANVLPILNLSVLGERQSGSIISSVQVLYQEGMWIIAALVLLVSILVPLIKLLLMLYVTASLHFKTTSRSLPLCYRIYHHLDEWGMLEVYLLGIIVAYVKLIALAEVTPGLGLYSFIGLILVISLLSSFMDEALFWDKIEALHHE